MIKGKRGLELSFAMIFSIIIIVATLGVAAYVLTNFLSLKNCSEAGLFYHDLDDFVQEAWREDIARKTFESELPSGISAVCFGNTSQSGNGLEYDALKRYGRNGENMFFYPPEKACNAAFNIDNLEIERWTCFKPISDKVSISLEKEIFDNSVKLCGEDNCRLGDEESSNTGLE